MKREVLVPAYYNKFQCIGSACEDTCCAGWKVSVDKATFNKYRKITPGPLATELKQNITRERKSPSELNYGKIKLDAKGNCTFLELDGLCKIQSELGEEALCRTCTVYPRHFTSVDDRLEKSLAVSCPEAARLILLNSNGIEFIVDEEEIDKKIVASSFKASDSFWDIRMFTISILQTRQVSLEERLIVLGMFFEKLDTIPQQQWDTQLAGLIDRYQQLIQDAEQLALLSNLPDNLSFQMDLVNKIIQHRSSMGLGNQRYIECINEMVQGLQMIEGLPIEQSTPLYKNAHTNYYQPFMYEHSYILENFLVNYVFKNIFPKNSSNTFYQYTKLIIHFMLIKSTLIGMASYHKTLSIDLSIKCIQSFSKIFEHNQQIFKDIQDELIKHKYMSMAHMIVLLKG